MPTNLHAVEEPVNHPQGAVRFDVRDLARIRVAIVAVALDEVGRADGVRLGGALRLFEVFALQRDHGGAER